MFLLFSAYQLTSTGRGTKEHQADALGRFEFFPGVLKEGGPVYRQAHSHQEIPIYSDYQLYRWATPPPPPPPPPNSFRTGDEWHVWTLDGWGDYVVAMKALVVGDNPTPLTSTEWKYNVRDEDEEDWDGDQDDNEDFVSDPTLICALPEDSAPCSVRLTLRGLAGDIQGKCQGIYKEYNRLRSQGRKVNSGLRR